MNTRITSAILATLLLVVASGTCAQVPLAGDWRLDNDASDHFDKLRERIVRLNDKRHTPNHARRQRGIANLGPPAFVGGISLKGLTVLDSKVLTIRDRADAVEFDFDSGHRRTLHPDRKTTSVSLSAYGRERNPMIRFSSWEGKQLVVETTRDSGLRIVEHWWIDGDGRLDARFTLHPPGLAEPISYRRIFVRNDGH